MRFGIALFVYLSRVNMKNKLFVSIYVRLDLYYI